MLLRRWWRVTDGVCVWGDDNGIEHCEEPVETEEKPTKECKKRGKEGKKRGGWGQRRKRLKGSQQMGSEKKDEVKQRMGWGALWAAQHTFFIAHLLVFQTLSACFHLTRSESDLHNWLECNQCAFLYWLFL